MRTGGNDENKKQEMLKVARKRKEIGRGCYMKVYVCGYVLEFPGVMQTFFFSDLWVHNFFPGSVSLRGV